MNKYILSVVEEDYGLRNFYIEEELSYYEVIRRCNDYLESISVQHPIKVFHIFKFFDNYCPFPDLDLDLSLEDFVRVFLSSNKRQSLLCLN